MSVAEIKDRIRQGAKNGYGGRTRALRGRALAILDPGAMDLVQPPRNPLKVEFEIQDQVDGAPYPTSLSAQAQRQFHADFHHRVGALEAWFQTNGWLTGHLTRPDPAGSATPSWRFDLPDTDLRVGVSNRFQLSRSLTLAAVGKRGRIEFPKNRVAAGEAGITHELAHVFFPNGNRMLAEGLAVYLQQELDAGPAHPNLGKELDQAVRDLLPNLGRGGLEQIDLSAFDAIATPDDLVAKIGEGWYGGSTTYLIAGSFVKFLIDGFGADRFYQLYMQTRLVPMGRNAGDPGRWPSFYGRPLGKLADDWKQRIAGAPAPAELSATTTRNAPDLPPTLRAAQMRDAGA